MSSSDISTCCICLSPLTIYGLGAIQCGHVFHVDCLKGLRASISQNNKVKGRSITCPICRTPFRKAIRLMFSFMSSSSSSKRDHIVRPPEQMTSINNLSNNLTPQIMEATRPLRATFKSHASVQIRLNQLSLERDDWEGRLEDLEAEMEQVIDDLAESKLSLTQLLKQEDELAYQHNRDIQKIHSSTDRRNQLFRQLSDCDVKLQECNRQILYLQQINEQCRLQTWALRINYLVYQMLSTINSGRSEAIMAYLEEFHALNHVNNDEELRRTEIALLLALFSDKQTDIKRVQELIQQQQSENAHLGFLGLEAAQKENLHSNGLIDSLKSLAPTSNRKKGPNQNVLPKKPLLASITKTKNETPSIKIQNPDRIKDSTPIPNGLGGITKVFKTNQGKSLYFLNE